MGHWAGPVISLGFMPRLRPALWGRVVGIWHTGESCNVSNTEARSYAVLEAIERAAGIACRRLKRRVSGVSVGGCANLSIGKAHNSYGGEGRGSRRGGSANVDDRDHLRVPFRGPMRGKRIGASRHYQNEQRRNG